MEEDSGGRTQLTLNLLDWDLAALYVIDTRPIREDLMLLLLFAATATLLPVPAASQSLSVPEIAKAVAYGKQFSTRSAFLKDGLKRRKFKIDGAFA